MTRGIKEGVLRFLGDARVTGAIGIVALLVTIILAPLGSALAGAIIAASALAVVVLVSIVGGYLLRDRFSEAYEVLGIAHRWDIKDATGTLALYKKSLHVRFLQNNIIAIWDTTWGQGTRTYQSCSPGKIVDSFNIGERTFHLISLREKRKRGDEITFELERKIVNGFRDASEWVQVQTTHSTKNITVEVLFPEQRPPTHVTLTTDTDDHVTDIGSPTLSSVGDRPVLHWTKQNPRKELFTFRWDWKTP